jgi:signal transduction histidine kinase
MQSTAGAALVISGQRFAGTALGAAFAALLVAHFGQSVEIELSVDNEQVILAIRDFGRGIPADLLRRFRESGTDVGVGLSGMSERAKDLGGHLEIESGGVGTGFPMSQCRHGVTALAT